MVHCKIFTTAFGPCLRVLPNGRRDCCFESYEGFCLYVYVCSFVRLAAPRYFVCLRQGPPRHDVWRAVYTLRIAICSLFGMLAMIFPRDGRVVSEQNISAGVMRGDRIDRSSKVSRRFLCRCRCESKTLLFFSSKYVLSAQGRRRSL